MAGLPLIWFGGASTGDFALMMRGAAMAAPLYFFVNSLLVAGAIAFSTRQPLPTVWHQNFLWSAPSYFAGAALAALAHAAWSRGWFGWLLLLALPLYLVFRSYHTVVGRLRKEQEDTRRAMEVQLATIESLALRNRGESRLHPGARPFDSALGRMLAEAASLSDSKRSRRTHGRPAA
jgi:hypothetical protein